ncbi:hypothetical protein FRC03_010467 [Tulasnella sp. 419]|nr:hypothetical protein FRC03_010467 [Tulasnella sp. 419]
MFYYVSFLRPPPQKVLITSKTFSICPQVANDLRTEFYEGDPLDLYFAWLPEASFASASHGASQNLMTRKLTTWKGASTAYKEIEISLPPAAKVQDEWRLAMWARSTTTSPNEENNKTTDNADPLPWLIELKRHATENTDFGSAPFPVLSEPILIVADEFTTLESHSKTKSRAKRGSRATAMAPKQERIERMYLLPTTHSAVSGPIEHGIICDGSDRLRSSTILRLTEQTSFDLDKKVWDSGLGLAAWLANLLFPRSGLGMAKPSENRLPMVLNPSAIDIRDLLLNPRGFSAVELGTGIGVVSLMLTALLESSELSGYSSDDAVGDPVRTTCSRKILATDLASAMPLIMHNFKQNASTYSSGKIQLQTGVLDWDSTNIFESCPDLGDFRTLDLIFMADVTYNTTSFPSLIRTIHSLVTSWTQNPNSDGCGGPRILMAYKERDPSERQLWDMAAKQVGVFFERVGGVEGAGEMEVEIWIGRCIVSELN